MKKPIIKSVNELAHIAKTNLYFNLLRYSVEELKLMEDEDGWTFLHYYFAIRVSEQLGLGNYYIYQLEEIKELKNLGLDFYKLAENNNYLELQGEDFYIKKPMPQINALTPLHIMFFNSTTSYVSDEYAELKTYIENNLILNTEDSLNLSPVAYALSFKNANVIHLLSQASSPILTPKMKNKKEVLFSLLNDTKEKINNSSQIYVDALKAKIEKECLEDNLLIQEKKSKSKIVKV
jgi:hypothetical protein